MTMSSLDSKDLYSHQISIDHYWDVVERLIKNCTHYQNTVINNNNNNSNNRNKNKMLGNKKILSRNQFEML